MANLSHVDPEALPGSSGCASLSVFVLQFLFLGYLCVSGRFLILKTEIKVVKVIWVCQPVEDASPRAAP